MVTRYYFKFLLRMTTFLVQCIGIELLPRLFDESRKREREFLSNNNPSQQGFTVPEICLYHGDFLQLDWGSPDVIYCSSILFEEDLVRAMIAKAEQECPAGTRFVSLKPLCSPRFALLSEGYFKMSWRMAYVYFYRLVGEQTEGGNESCRTMVSLPSCDKKEAAAGETASP